MKAVFEEPRMQKQDTGDLVKLVGVLAIFAVTFTAVAAFFNLSQ